MLLTLTSTQEPATDIGYLLRKNPARPQSFDLSFGKAHVFYSEATPERCTVALLVEVDPVGLVRNRRGPSGEGGALEQYVNDRPYAASSFLSVAIAEVFGSALSGKSKERPELVDTPLPLRVTFSTLPCRGGEEFLRKMFEPLGYAVSARRLPLDEKFPDWGESSYFQVELNARLPLQQLLSHLYVLVPVLDNDKHYWVSDDEVEKLLRHGEGWLASHPEREAITRRYLKHQRSLVDDALTQLADESEPNPDAVAEIHAQEEEAIERNISLNEQRLGSVLAALKSTGAARVLDLGCGEGRLLQALLKEKQFTEIVGMDVSHRALEIAHDRLHYDRLPPVQKERLRFLHGSLIYRDQRLAGFDAAAVVEVIEHLDAARLAAFERVLFECAKPKHIVITTPNSEYNVKWETLPAGKFRHRDHRFEWARAEFQNWANGVALRFGYNVRFLPVGPEDSAVGSPTQMGVFTLSQTANMDDEQKEFEKLAVMLLFKRIREGRVTLDSITTPNLSASLESVHFDEHGEPIMNSVNSQVRLMAMTIANEEANQLEDALNKTGDRMGIDGLLPKETEVTDSVLGKCQSEDDFTRLAFELFKEAACLASVASCAYKTEIPTKFPWDRSQSVCAGLLIRVVKFMQAIARLYASGDSAEVNLALGRCVMEAAVNVRFLLKRNSPQMFDEFVRYSFIAERKLSEDIQKNIAGRSGRILPIEQRMLNSIDRCLSDSGITLGDVPVKGRVEDVVGNLWERLDALGIAQRYTGQQRIASHAIHGDWADLVLFHLTHENGHYGPQIDFCPEEPGLFLPLSIVVLEATSDYLQHFYPNTLDSETLLRRIRDLADRIMRVGKGHEMSRSRDSATTG